MTTSTRDDRVHPYHARCFVKRLLDVQRDELAVNNNDDIHDNRSKGNIIPYFYCKMIVRCDADDISITANLSCY